MQERGEGGRAEGIDPPSHRRVVWEAGEHGVYAGQRGSRLEVYGCRNGAGRRSAPGFPSVLPSSSEGWYVIN